VIEVVAHDHFADVRYNSFKDPKTGKTVYYHNFFVAPGATPDKNQNPGYSIFEIDEVTFEPKNLRFTFLDIHETYGHTTIPSLSKLTFRECALSDFGLVSLTPESIHQFRLSLEEDKLLTIRYLISKMGLSENRLDKEFK
jgi:hypothetical protein